MDSLPTSPIQIYSNQEWTIQVDVRIDKETIWLNQNQMAELFDVNQPAISKHIDAIYHAKELVKNWTHSKMEWVQKEWKRMVKRMKDYYNLDMIISVWYRVNSKQATQFRIRATQILKQHITQWYTTNQQRLSRTGLTDLVRSVALIQRTLDTKSLSGDEAQWLLRLITQYIPSLITLWQYDANSLPSLGKITEATYTATVQDANTVLSNLKKQLIKDNEATELFAQPKDSNWIQSIIGAVYQTYDSQDVYNSVEEKAANLLYLTIKNHPFVDGNKRSWAFLFVWFLSNNGILHDQHGILKINQQTLVALALLVATSAPGEKSLMIRLIIQLIS